MNLFRWASEPTFDLVGRVQRLERGYPRLKSNSALPSTSAYRIPSRAAVSASGLLAPNAVSAKGSLSAYVLSGNLGFAATANSITIYYDGTNSSQQIVIKRADGTSFTVPAGAQTIQGLVAGTQYGFSVYWNTSSTRGLSFGAGDAGAPQIAISPNASQAIQNAALQAQQGVNAEAIYSGLVYYSTLTGTTVGSGTGISSSGQPYAPIRVRGQNVLSS